MYETSGQGEETDIGEEEIEIAKAIRITLGNFNFVVEAFQLAGVYREFGVCNKAVQTF